MEIFITILLFLIAIAVWIFVWASRKRRPNRPQPLPRSYREILTSDVPFYQSLDPHKKTEIEQRLMHFLAHTKITGVKTEVEDIDRVYIAASAIIPIFGFPGWEYSNLNEVLVYPDSFDHDFRQSGNERNILGIVGEGAYQHIMIISRRQLREAFANSTNKDNTAIHEFVHLIDKTDGTIDGVPEVFMDKQYVLPWLRMMRKEIEKILDERSDIDPYGAHSEAEFFAVVSEYFFKRPDLLKEKNPELYGLLVQMFRQRL